MKISRSFWAMYGAAFLIAAAGFAVAYHFVGAPPPRVFRLAAGAKGGAYYGFAHQYAAFMAKRGIQVEVVETAGSVENLRLLQDPSAHVDVALVQGGVMDEDTSKGLVGLGSVGYEPLWVFHRAGTNFPLLCDLKGHALAVGAEGSGTRPLALKLLAANGIQPQNTALLPLGGTNAVAALLAGRVEALFMVSSFEAESVRRLLEDRRLALMGFVRANAYARRFRTLSAVRLPEGIVDLEHNVPATDVRLVSPAAMLVARESFHPALADLTLQAAASVHAGGDIFAEPGLFPSRLYTDVPLSRDAERYFKFGPPVLQRYLPFWVANTVDRIKIMLVPLLVLLLPLFKIVPPTFRWRIRSRITRWYRELSDIDAQVNFADAVLADELMAEIDRVEHDVIRVSVPLGFADQLYNLRSHIALVRERILARRKACAPRV
ncbi:MAG: TAXI family TRAP transporter solute-binding subunit [bacterium]